MKKKLTTLILGLGLFALSGCTEFAANVQEIDTSGNGKLSPREISAALVQLADNDGDEVLNQSELEEGLARINLLKQWDVNDDGRVTSLDFAFLFPPTRGDIDTRFSLWDDDGNGVVSNPELADVLFKKFDLDRDDSLDRGEMERVVVMYDGISAYDLDEDGELSFGELRAMRLEL